MKNKRKVTFLAFERNLDKKEKRQLFIIEMLSFNYTNTYPKAKNIILIFVGKLRSVIENIYRINQFYFI